MKSLAIELSEGITALGLQTVVTEAMQTQCLAYMALLQKWNQVYNLTAVRDPRDMLVLHVLDSLSVIKHIDAGRMLDVGSGGGLPGIVIAITRPDVQVTTIDTVQKKAIFMRQVKAELQLDNLQVVHGRVEQHQPAMLYTQIISRAFSEISLFKQLTQHLLAPSGQWLAMKGVNPTEELLKAGVVPSNVIRLQVPQLNAERHLVVFENPA